MLLFYLQRQNPLSSLWAAKVRGQKTVLSLLMPLLGEAQQNSSPTTAPNKKEVMAYPSEPPARKPKINPIAGVHILKCKSIDK